MATSSGARLFGEACSLALHSAPARVLVDAVTSQVYYYVNVIRTALRVLRKKCLKLAIPLHIGGLQLYNSMLVTGFHD